ncbi:MAG: hypothetical protein DRI56_01015, partial [Chloroflexota bacterium]
MTKISLRAYNQEIENMINERQIEEAIAHCQHILETFPKHIGTYRLLGKAYLESSQHSNAADIFQRILSAIPDDFVSHIGMSIIREDEGNFEAATAHMEKAFEKQPYNPAIQDELRRLYGKRDGMEPPKVQLTQGALARMYLKGNLVQQGIAELRSALAKNSKQIDLLALLAEAYIEINKKNEALEVASTILKKFPYNITANRIMTELLSVREHPKVMKACRQRLYALSPYQMHISEHAPTEEQVPDRAITLTQLDWIADREAQTQTSAREKQPDWATSIGINIESEEDEDQLPSWLTDDASEGAEEQTSVHREPFPGSEKTDKEEEDIIPDWMQEAGWGVSTDKVDESEQNWFSDEEEEEEKLTPANIPDWLREKEPSTSSTESAQKNNDTILKGTDWLTELEEEELPELSEIDADIADIQEIPDWLKELGEEEDTSQPKEEIQSWQDQEKADEPPSWLADMEAEPEESTFIEELGEVETVAPAEKTEDIPEWLSDLEGEEETHGTVMSWLEAEKEPEPIENDEPPLEKTEDIPAWLSDLQKDESLEEPMPSMEEAETVAPAEKTEDIPEWLSDLEGEEETHGTVMSWLEAEKEPEPIENDEPPPEEEAEPIAAAEEVDELPAWLSDIKDEEELEPLPEEEAEPVTAAEEVDELPAWLSDIEKEEEPEPIEAASEPVEETASEMPD